MQAVCDLKLSAELPALQRTRSGVSRGVAVVRAPLTTPSDGCGLKLASGWVLYMVIGMWDDCAMHKRPRRVVYITGGVHRHLPLVEGPSRAADACLAARIAAAAAGLLLVLGVAVRLRHSCVDAVTC